MMKKIKRIIFLLRNKGWKYTFNYLHFVIFWVRRHELTRKFLYWFSPYPSYIEIEVTTRCNLRCIICEHTYWNEPNRDMTFEEFKYIVDQFPHLKWIGLTGIGESFLNKDFLKMLEYVKKKSVYVELYDSFYFIDEKMAGKIIDLEIDKMLVSIDAATKETYEKIRVGSNFDKVINNVKTFIEIKEKQKAILPEIDFHFIVNKINMHEMVFFLELVNSIKRNQNVTVFFTRMLHNFPQINNLFIEIPEEIKVKINHKAKELKINTSWNADVPFKKPPIYKCREWIMPFIFVTGHVIPCCSGNEANRREFQKETSLGNIFEKSFKEIWYGENYKTLRRKLYKGEVPIQCQNCCLYELPVKL